MKDVVEISEKRLQENKDKFYHMFQTGQGSTVTCRWREPGLALSQVEQYESEERDFDYKRRLYNIQAEAVNEGFDNVPGVSFFGDIAYMMTLGYGCPMRYQNDLVISTFRYKDSEEAENFRYLPDIYDRGLYKMALERAVKFGERYPQIPITISDLQSPVDTITEFLPAEEAIYLFYDDPELAHRILSTVTQSTIDLVRHYEKTIKNFGGFRADLYLPFGIHLSDDNAAFLSPEIYREFAAPYAERLAEEFGGVTFHVCMKFEQNLKNLANVKGFLGFDAMPYYNDPAKVLDALGGNKVWELKDYNWTRPAGETEKPIDFYKRLIDQNEGRNALRIDTFHEDKDEALKLAWEVKNYLLKKE